MMEELIKAEQQKLQQAAVSLITLIGTAVETSSAIKPENMAYNYIQINPEGATSLLNQIIESQNQIARLMDEHFPAIQKSMTPTEKIRSNYNPVKEESGQPPINRPVTQGNTMVMPSEENPQPQIPKKKE